MGPEHADSDKNSIFTLKSTTTTATEWTEDEGVDGNDAMSVLSSMYVIATIPCPLAWF
jgi:hypothetical protein